MSLFLNFQTEPASACLLEDVSPIGKVGGAKLEVIEIQDFIKTIDQVEIGYPKNELSEIKHPPISIENSLKNIPEVTFLSEKDKDQLWKQFTTTRQKEFARLALAQDHPKDSNKEFEGTKRAIQASLHKSLTKAKQELEKRRHEARVACINARAQITTIAKVEPVGPDCLPESRDHASLETLSDLSDIYAEDDEKEKFPLSLETNKGKVADFLNKLPDANLLLDSMCNRQINPTYTAGQIYKALKNPDYHFTLAIDKRTSPPTLQGFIIEQRTPKQSHVNLVCSKFKGLGTKLLSKASKGAKLVELDAIPDAQGFYKKLGFQDDSTIVAPDKMSKLTPALEQKLRSFASKEQARWQEIKPTFVMADYDSMDLRSKKTLLDTYNETTENYKKLKRLEKNKRPIDPHSTPEVGDLIDWAIGEHRPDIINRLSKIGFDLRKGYKTSTGDTNLVLGRAATQGHTLLVAELLENHPTDAFSPEVVRSFGRLKPEVTQEFLKARRTKGSDEQIKELARKLPMSEYYDKMDDQLKQLGEGHFVVVEDGDHFSLIYCEKVDGQLTLSRQRLAPEWREDLLSLPLFKNGKLIFPCRKQLRSKTLQCF